MKKLIFPIVCCFISITVSAQLVKQEAETQKKQSELDWFNCSFDKDSVYGAEVNKAYEYLKANKKKAKKRPVVALIGTGMDVEHEDLKHAIWMNPKEIPICHPAHKRYHSHRPGHSGSLPPYDRPLHTP